CCERKALIFIDRRTYERVPSHHRVPVTINATIASSHQEFWEAAERTGAVHPHYDLILEDGTRRHYGIYIDLVALLTDSWFRNRIAAELRRVAAPTIALIPKHRASEALHALLVEAYPGVETEFVPAGPLSDQLVNRLRSLTEAHSILIADDGLVSSATL